MQDFVMNPFVYPGLVAVDVPGFPRFYAETNHEADVLAQQLMLMRASTLDALADTTSDVELDTAGQLIREM